jgi:hypothetical protein
VTYDQELTTTNEQELEDFLTRYKTAARIVKPETPKRSGKPGGTADAEIRKWAREQDIEVPARGKISDDVRAAYKARNKAKTPPAGTPAKEG